MHDLAGVVQRGPGCGRNVRGGPGGGGPEQLALKRRRLDFHPRADQPPEHRRAGQHHERLAVEEGPPTQEQDAEDHQRRIDHDDKRGFTTHYDSGKPPVTVNGTNKQTQIMTN